MNEIVEGDVLSSGAGAIILPINAYEGGLKAIWHAHLLVGGQMQTYGGSAVTCTTPVNLLARRIPGLLHSTNWK